jgi:adenylate cyclase class IV
MTKNREIEYGVKIKNSNKLISYLNSNAVNKGTIKSTRKIFKKLKSDYFFRTDQQTQGSKNKYFFSMKEDILLKKGVRNGMKVSDEIDIEVSSSQLKKLEEIVILLGFNQTNIISKTRRTYFVGKLMVTIDSYPDNDYLEIEGTNKKDIMNLVSRLPIEKI